MTVGEKVNGLLATSPGTRSEAFGAVEWSLLAVVVGIWGSSFLLIAIGLDSFEPPLITVLRLALGVSILALIPASRHRIERSDWGRTILLGIVWIAVPLLLIPIGQQWVDSSLAGMINGSMPLFAALFAALLLRRAPRAVQAVGLILGFVGVSAIAFSAGDGTAGTALGVLLILVATIFYALAVNLAVPLQQRYGSLPVVLHAQLIALVLVTPLGLAALPESAFSWPSAVAVAFLGIFGTGLAFVAMATLAGRAGATRGSVAIYFLPVVAIVLGVAFRDEQVTVAAVIGTALVLIGAYLTSRAEHGGESSGEAEDHHDAIRVRVL